jgi:hypothetical protein
MTSVIEDNEPYLIKLINALQSNTSLTRLDLTYDACKGKLAAPIVELLKSNTTIKFISVPKGLGFKDGMLIKSAYQENFNIITKIFGPAISGIQKLEFPQEINKYLLRNELINKAIYGLENKNGDVTQGYFSSMCGLLDQSADSFLELSPSQKLLLISTTMKLQQKRLNEQSLYAGSLEFVGKLHSALVGRKHVQTIDMLKTKLSEVFANIEKIFYTGQSEINYALNLHQINFSESIGSDSTPGAKIVIASRDFYQTGDMQSIDLYFAYDVDVNQELGLEIANLLQNDKHSKSIKSISFGYMNFHS